MAAEIIKQGDGRIHIIGLHDLIDTHTCIKCPVFYLNGGKCDGVSENPMAGDVGTAAISVIAKKNDIDKIVNEGLCKPTNKLG